MLHNISQPEAADIFDKLSNAPTPPESFAHLINVGTDHLLDGIEKNYFKDQLHRGLGAFKYVQAPYGGGKTQFILSLAERAHRNGIVACRFDIGQDCPFNSKLAIFRSIMSSFLPPPDGSGVDAGDRGVDVLIQRWIDRRLRESGVDRGCAVPDQIRAELRQALVAPMTGVPDHQMAVALRRLGERLLDQACGANWNSEDDDLLSWIRGDKVTSLNLKRAGVHEPARDETAFGRLSTAFRYLRTRTGYRGFFIAFDEGGRVISFRRGGVQQRQTIENLLDIIAKTADQHFAGVLFLYAATEEFRSAVIANYEALDNRIGNVSMSAGSPMVPFIDIQKVNTPDLFQRLGERLMDIYEAKEGHNFDRRVQKANIKKIYGAYDRIGTGLRMSPRTFIAVMTRFLPQQAKRQRVLDEEDAEAFITDAEPDDA